MYSNLLGVAGLAAIAVAIGALSGNWWWAALSGGFAAVVLAVVAQYNTARTSEAAEAPRSPRSRSG